MSWVSSSGQRGYLEIAELAIRNDLWFKTFRCDPRWFAVTGVTEPGFAVECIKVVLADEFVKNQLHTLHKIDTFLQPLMKLASGLSTEMIRHCRDASNIHKHFGDLKDFKVVEFGSNIGLLAYCLLTLNPEIMTYNLVDLPKILQLSQKVLRTAGINVERYSSEPSNGDKIDLFISSLSLTEFTDDDLYRYYDVYIDKAEGIYIVCNIPEPERYNRFINKLQQDFDLTIQPEIKIKHPDTVLIGKRK